MNDFWLEVLSAVTIVDFQLVSFEYWNQDDSNDDHDDATSDDTMTSFLKERNKKTVLNTHTQREETIAVKQYAHNQEPGMGNAQASCVSRQDGYSLFSDCHDS